MFSLKRRRVLRERQEAVEQRVVAVNDLVAAFREVEAALDGLRAANGRFYYSNFPTEQGILNALRRERESTFCLLLLRELAAAAPLFARLLQLAPAHGNHKPIIEWIQHVNRHDLHLPDPEPAAANEGARP